MSSAELGASNRLSDALRAALDYGFGDYHTRIATQIVLMDQLVAAVGHEERERCARLVEKIARATWPAKPEQLGSEIAAAVRRDGNL